MGKNYTFIDLFAGCGGLSEGILSTGKFHGLAHVEWELPMVNTLRNRLVSKWNYSEEDSKKSVVHFDIQKTNELLHGSWTDETRKDYEDTNHPELIASGLKGIVKGQKVDLIIGGPPCQAYSIAGRAQDKNSMKDDYRNFLFESFVKVVQEFKPQLFVFENVPGMLSAAPGGKKVTERIYESFGNIGYEINLPNRLSENVYSAHDFGVPQKRNRVILIGVRKDSSIRLVDVYKAIDNEKSDEKPVTKDVLLGLPEFVPLNEAKKENGKNISHALIGEELIDGHQARYHNQRDIKIFREWIQKKMNDKPSTEKVSFYNDKFNKTSNHAKYRNLEWDKPSPTIVAHLYKDGLMFIHPDEQQARSITVKEAALLQSFPKDYSFLGPQGYCYKMIGNAVPPLMAKAIGEGIFKILNQKYRMKILVACEESQAVTKELRALGHEAYSCDILECSGGKPEWHFPIDVFKVIKERGGELQNGGVVNDGKKWDMMIAHPPCTYLAVSGARWFYHPEDKHLPTKDRRPHPRFKDRRKKMEEALDFFIKLMEADIDKIAIENPVGLVSSRYRKPNQIVQPWMFGDAASKKTCLWLKGLPKLEPTVDLNGEIDKGERVVLKSGRSLPKWYSDALTKAKTPAERRTLRSKTFKGMAAAMAKQWTELN